MEKQIVYDFDSVISREGTYAEKYEARRKFFGKADVEPFWVADMDLPTPGFLVDALRRRLEHSMFGYTSQYDAVFEAIRWWMEYRHEAVIESNAWILLSPSVVTSISLAIQAFTPPDGAVALLSPVYGPFFSCSTANGRQVADCPLKVEQGRFRIDFDAFEAVAARSDVSLLLLCNPQNPGGRSWDEGELDRVARICRENGVIIFSDEIHCDIVYEPHRHISMLNIPDAQGSLVVAHSIGKTFNCSGLQASSLIIPDAGLRERFRGVQNCVHAGDINLLGKVALASALSPAGAEYRQQLVRYLHENVRQVCGRLRQLNHAVVMEPEATFLIWVDLRNYGSRQEVARRLIHEANIALSGGDFFGPAGNGWFRINCAHPRSLLLPAIDRMLAVLDC